MPSSPVLGEAWQRSWQCSVPRPPRAPRPALAPRTPCSSWHLSPPPCFPANPTCHTGGPSQGLFALDGSAGFGIAASFPNSSAKAFPAAAEQGLLGSAGCVMPEAA